MIVAPIVSVVIVISNCQPIWSVTHRQGGYRASQLDIAVCSRSKGNSSKDSADGCRSLAVGLNRATRRRKTPQYLCRRRGRKRSTKDYQQSQWKCYANHSSSLSETPVS